MKRNRQLIKRRCKQFRLLIQRMAEAGFDRNLTIAVLKKRMRLIRGKHD